MTPVAEQELLAQPATNYMNDTQLAFFRERLQVQRAGLQARIAAEFDLLREQESHSDSVH